MWIIFALKLLLVAFLWDRVADFSISAWPSETKEGRSVIAARLLSYVVPAIVIGPAAGLTLLNHPEASKSLYLLTGLVAALPAPALHLEDSRTVIGFSFCINIPVYCLMAGLTVLFLDSVPTNLINMARWVAV